MAQLHTYVHTYVAHLNYDDKKEINFIYKHNQKRHTAKKNILIYYNIFQKNN